jgi:GTP-binding protein
MKEPHNRNVVAIVGRPNVGKSSLFNRILGRRVAIVEKHSGTTRDRLGQQTSWQNVPFELVDSGGIVTEPDEELARLVTFQVEVAISEASVILFVVDASEGLTPLDREIAATLRKRAKARVILVMNKCDDPDRLHLISEFYELGFEKLFGVSAAHGLGIGNLLDETVSLVGQASLSMEIPETSEPALRVAVVGQPNVGKSTFINVVLGQERLIVHDLPGTTRDSIDVPYQTQDGERIVFVDTAGIRRRRSMSRPIEKLSSLRAEESIERCHVAILMLEAFKGATVGDARIAHLIREKQKGCVIAVNKWDLVEDIRQSVFSRAVYDKLPFLTHCPVLFTVATTGAGLEKVLRTTLNVHRESKKQIPTPVLNRLVRDALQHRAPPSVSPGKSGRGTSSRRRLKVYYATQTGVSPPRIRLFVNDASLAKPDYLTYLTHRVRDSFPFPGSPVLLELRERS